MAYRNEERDRMGAWRDDADRERWEWDQERSRWGRDPYEWRGEEPRGEGRWELERGEPDRWGGQPRPRHRRFGHWYGRFGPPEGVGSAAGYSGFGGPGWTPGGFGDPGYNTSGFSARDYGTSRPGAGYDRSASREPMPMVREDYEDLPETAGGYESRWGSGDYRIYEERPGEERWIGPHTGRGPKGYQRSDDRIREDVSERLMDDGRIDAVEIVIEVETAEVTLSGTVPDRRMKRLAEDAAESVRGVRDVHNQLRIVGRKSADREMSLTPEAETLRKGAGGRRR